MLTEKDVQDMTKLARDKGVYPGWNIDADGNLRPRMKEQPIMSPTGKVLNQAACDAATTALGFRLEPNSLWFLPYFDVYFMVRYQHMLSYSLQYYPILCYP